MQDRFLRNTRMQTMSLLKGVSLLVGALLLWSLLTGIAAQTEDNTIVLGLGIGAVLVATLLLCISVPTDEEQGYHFTFKRIGVSLAGSIVAVMATIMLAHFFPDMRSLMPVLIPLFFILPVTFK